VSGDRHRVVVVGAGGHARVVTSLLRLMPEVEVVGVADRTSSAIGERIGDTKIVTTFDDLPELLHSGVTWAALALGDNRERSEMLARLKSGGFSLLTAVHPTAVIEADAKVGEGAVICAGAIVCTEVVIGPGVIINTGAIVDHECVVEECAHVAPGCCLAGRVHVGARTLVGAGSRVIPNRRVGADCVIGAGSVVVGDIPDGSVAYGVPARVQRHV
jgi:sugar O-acyltransferase (sialic acid O-acetyltransferase NeuD family)